MSQIFGQRDKHNLPNVIKAYDQGWADMMVTIWTDRIDTFHAVRTGALKGSVQAFQPIVNGISSEFRFTFNHYGVDVENGVGNGYFRDNGGDLKILDYSYREEHGLNEPKRSGRKGQSYLSSGHMRERRPWFTPSWWYSRRVIGQQMVKFLGDEYVGMFDQLTK